MKRETFACETYDGRPLVGEVYATFVHVIHGHAFDFLILRMPDYVFSLTEKKSGARVATLDVNPKLDTPDDMVSKAIDAIRGKIRKHSEARVCEVMKGFRP